MRESMLVDRKMIKCVLIVERCGFRLGLERFSSAIYFVVS